MNAVGSLHLHEATTPAEKQSTSVIGRRFVHAWSSRQPWGPYVPGSDGRDLRIDLLRGFAVVAMVVDHIAGSSPLYIFTGGNRFYTSAAEGFIFISGLVMGLVYRRFIQRDGLSIPLRRALERSLTLYLLTITLTLLVITLSESSAVHWAQGVDLSDRFSFVVSVLALHRTYYLVDIPLLYTILIVVAPLALLLLSQGRTAVVLGASWILWLAYQFFPAETDVPWVISGNYLFFASAWQVFFFTGLVLGWHHAGLTVRLARFPRRTALFASFVGTALFVGFYWVINRLPTFWQAADPVDVQEIRLFLIDAVFGKADVRPGRIIASIVVFGFLYLLVTEFWRPIYRALGWFLLPLGQSALYAYSAHVLIALPLALAIDSTAVPQTIQQPLNGLIQLAVLVLIWLLIRRRILFIDPARGWARYVLPAATVIATLILLPLDPSPRTPGIASVAAATDPYASRVARAFGTPIPGRPHPNETVVALPAPRPSLRQVGLPAIGPEARASQYVGSIDGSFQNIRFYSPALDREMQYFIYLPPRYTQENRSYNVLIMLHGNSGSFEEWPGYGLVGAADELIAARELLPLIIVMPQGDFSYWVNQADGGLKYGDYTVVDLVRHIRATYRVLPGSEHWAIGGLSMGGFGALTAAFRYPDVFRVVGAHSPALPAEGERDFLGVGKEFADRDPTQLALKLTLPSKLHVWIDAGDEDPWVDRGEQLGRRLTRRGVQVETHVFPGEHWGGYWMEHIVDYLHFYDRALNPERQP